MSAIGAVILAAAGKLALPFVKKILGDKIGGEGLAGELIDVIAEKIGVPAERLPEAEPGALEKALVEVEPLAAELLAQHVESQRLAAALQHAEIGKGPFWTWAWRPGWMWLLGLFWLYGLVLRPVVNAAFAAAIEPVDLSILMALTGAYLALYMGGHTVKDAVKRWVEK